MNQRQKTILDKLTEQEVWSVSALAQELSVSKMTIYRDLEGLQQAGLIRKYHGKVTAAAKLSEFDQRHCPMCGRVNHQRTTFTVLTQGGQRIQTCCPHCGMMAVSRVDGGWQSLATDFLHGHVITASQAHYLVLSDLTICCSPSVLAFAKKEEAIKFQVGFGGRILDFHLALAFVTHGVLPS